jgi:hypothetical protein
MSEGRSIMEPNFWNVLVLVMAVFLLVESSTWIVFRRWRTKYGGTRFQLSMATLSVLVAATVISWILVSFVYMAR